MAHTLTLRGSATLGDWYDRNLCGFILVLYHSLCINRRIPMLQMRTLTKATKLVMDHPFLNK